MTNISDRIRCFRDLHQSGGFVIPNPWDLGSARTLARLGFPALATTSSGFAWSLGRRDNQIFLGEALDHMRSITAGVDVPVNADFEGGFAVEPEGVAANVSVATRTGVAGLSIEDSTGDSAQPLFDFELSVQRIRAARRAIDESGTGVLLTGRSEGFIVGRPDLAETIRRLTAYAEAGADCLYAPGIRTREQISAVVTAVAPKPVNALVGGDFTTVSELAELGVRRISVGGALARAAWTGFLEAANEIAKNTPRSHMELIMNRAAIAIGVGLVLMVAAGAALPATDADEQAIRQHIERHYFDGVRRSDTALAHGAFHPVAKMFFVRDGKLVERSIPDWLADIARNAPKPAQPDGFKRRVLDVDVSGSAATAKLQLDYANAVIIDYMSLLKENGQWLIVSKIFDRKALGK